MQKIHNQSIKLSLADILKGPAYTEGLDLNALLDSGNNGIFIGKDKDLARNFYLAYFLDQKAIQTETQESKKKHLVQALEKYSAFVESKPAKSEAVFYAMLRSAQIRIHLNAPWPQIEESLLAAFALYPNRGEPIEAIQRHYLAESIYPIAYIYTSYSFENFHMKPPENGKWGVNEKFYQWKALDQHIAATFNLGLRDQAKDLFKLLLEQTRRNPKFFTPEDIQIIQSKSQVFEEVVTS